MRQRSYDVVVIGGGLLGCAIARDAAGRGLSVLVCDKGDLGGGATSALPGLVHGDLANLVHGRWGLLRRNLRERARVHAAAPNAVRPQLFLLPHHGRLRARRWLGSRFAVYDRLRRSTLPRTRQLDLETWPERHLLKETFDVAFAFHDYLGDSHRLTVLNALDAQARGATIATRVRCVVAEREGLQWSVSMENIDDGATFQVKGRALVNAAGAAVADTADHVIHASQRLAVAHARSVTVYLPRRPGDVHAYALPGHDGRIVYLLPGPGELMRLVGAGEPAGEDAAEKVSEREVAGLCDIAGQYLAEVPSADDVVHAEAAITVLPAGKHGGRSDHGIDVDVPPQLAPLVSAFGGNVTAHRWLAERAVGPLAGKLRAGRAWTAGARLPGGELPGGGPGEVARTLTRAYPFLGSRHAERLVELYGTRASDILSGARTRDDLGTWFGAYLTAREVRFLQAEEWAKTPEDALRRAGLWPQHAAWCDGPLAAMFAQTPRPAAADAA